MNDCQYVLSNVHGYLHSFNQLLGDWDSENETLVVTGNIINYGHNSFLVCKRLIELKQMYPDKVVFLKGKHEIFFETFYRNPSFYYEKFLEEGGLSTLLSFEGEGVSYEEMNDRYYMLNAVLPDIDFMELFGYLISASDSFETESSVYFSYNKNLLDLSESGFSFDKKKMFLTTDEDPRFKVHYLNHYLPEYLSRNNSFSYGDLSLFKNNYVLLGKEPAGLTEASSYGHHISNGIVIETTQVFAQD